MPRDSVVYMFLNLQWHSMIDITLQLIYKNIVTTQIFHLKIFFHDWNRHLIRWHWIEMHVYMFLNLH